MSNPLNSKVLLKIYSRLMKKYGPQQWWPGDSQFEIIIGAILTQSAAWTNVEKAIINLKAAGALIPDRIEELPLGQLADLIRPSGYYNAKAKKLKAFVSWLKDNYDYNLDSLFAVDTEKLRRMLLSVHGIGEETADSIILYAAEKPVFVIDAYTRRTMSRIGLMPLEAGYSVYQQFFMHNLPVDIKMFNEYHALLVKLGKSVCRKSNPACGQCCLESICKKQRPELA